MAIFFQKLQKLALRSQSMIHLKYCKFLNMPPAEHCFLIEKYILIQTLLLALFW